MNEWLATDGLGGFATGCVDGTRARRYHGLCTVAHGGRRWLMVAAIDLEVDGQALSTHAYQGGVRHPQGAQRLIGFTPRPWPCWRYRLDDGKTVEVELAARAGGGWRLSVRGAGRVRARPLLAGRDMHALTHENGVVNLQPSGGVFQLYPGVPPLEIAGGRFVPGADWYRRFELSEERERGFDFVEDLASPGVFELERGVLDFGLPGAAAPLAPRDVAADYLVELEGRASVIAGYPWFGDWGRDTFIALPGLCLGDAATARKILEAWAPLVHHGLLPNRFPDGESVPEYHSVDAALWYVLAARGHATPAVQAACRQIVEGYRRGTLHRIGMAGDGLLAAGEPGLQLTWMDARVDGREVTPRIGKPVELQALWIRAQEAVGLDASQARQSLLARFWDQERGFLADVVDADHMPGRVDASLRPNQLLALPLLPPALARRALVVIERELVTPYGPRSLGPHEPGYCARYQGSPRERDAAYHQGTVWPYWIGAHVEACLHAGTTPPDLAPLLAHAASRGGHVAELFDAEPPHVPRGAPFQAWSVAELRRAVSLLDAAG